MTEAVGSRTGATAAEIRLDTGKPGHAVSPLIYSQFIEHAGACVYDGIWVGPDSDIPNDGGLRLDTLDALRRLEPPVMRWPGGLWADSYHWRDGIGPPAQRPIRQNLGWNTVESNAFGTHEFMRFCRLIGAEPYVCVNVGSGTVREAVEWVEYCNSEADTTLTRERSRHGSPEPFRVKFWGLGNEPYYALDGLMRAEYYTDLARQYAGYIKHVAAQRALRFDPGFHDVSVVWGVPPARGLEPPGGAYVDMIAVHRYATLANESPSYQADVRVSLEKLERDVREACARSEELSTPEHDCLVAVDEWGKWNQSEATPNNGLKQRCVLGDALFAAAGFHLFHRYPRVRMANMAQAVNIVQALVLTRGRECCLTPTYHAWEMLKPHRGGRVVPATVVLSGAERGNGGSADDASASATLSSDGRGLFLSVVNFDHRRGVSARLVFAESKSWVLKEHRVLTGSHVDSENTFERPRCVSPVEREVESNRELEVSLPPLSVTTLRMTR